ncbi:DNA-directed RNA polymerase subunit H [Candidatus Woesearchaeota archaeon]|nr:DNA-directed RNA polymerase subunit H [Candidatus Woesearchaeota archaeon]
MEHRLIPPHSKLNESEKKQLLEKYNLSVKDLPKIIKDDPALGKIQVKAGDIIKIERKSPTAGLSYYYRVVVEE